MNKKFLIWTIIVVVIIVAGYFGFVYKYCSYVEQDSNGGPLCRTFWHNVKPFLVSQSNEEKERISRSVIEKPEQTVDWKNYNNGVFRLTFTDSWKGYKTEDQSISSNFGTGSVVFSVPTKSKQYNDSGYFEMFIIFSYNSEYWKLVENTDGPKPVFLARSGDRVFAYDRAQDVTDEDYPAYSDISKIIATFKLVK